MAENNVFIRIQAQSDTSDAQVQLQDLTTKGKDLQRQMAEMTTAENNLRAAQKRRVDEGKNEDKKLNELIADHQRMRREIQGEINDNNKSIASLKQAISTQAAMEGGGKRMAVQIRQIRDELAKTEITGNTSSQAFVDMTAKAAELTNQMRHTQQQIKALASDTKSLDAAMGVGAGLTGVFTAATSAAALLGGENEALQKSFLQVQAAIAVLNGVQQVANALGKNSVANVTIRTALNKLFNKEKAKEATTTATAATASAADAAAKGVETVATTAATAATNKFTRALLKNPVMLVVAAIAALVAGLIYLVQVMDENEEKQRDFNGELERTKNLMNNIKNDTDFAAKLAEAEGKSQEEILKIRRDGAKKALDQADANQRRLEKKAEGHYEDLSDEEKQALADARALAQEAWNDLNAINQEAVILQAKQRKQAHDDEIEESKRRNEEIADAQKQLNRLRIEAMAEGLPKEIARIKNDYQERIRAIKGNSRTETALRIALQAEMQRKIDEATKKTAGETEQTNYSNDSMAIENALAEAEGLYQIKAALLKRQAEIEKAHIEATVTNEVEKANRLRAIDIKLSQDLEANRKTQATEEISDAKRIAENRVMESENAALRILQDENSTDDQIRAARETLANHDANLRQVRLDELKEQYDNELIDYQTYQTNRLDIEREALDQEAEMLAKQAALTQQLTTTILQFVGDMANEIFSLVSDNISQQLEDLDKMYTTDAEEAKNDANKKYITEKELANKKLELKRKQARIDKATAAFNIGLNTAMAIMSIWADPTAVWAMKIALTATTAALGAAQLAIALAKPLPQYAKGRKGGKGEYALVGEKGPEVMYIPQGASIVPNNKMDNPAAWSQFGVPAMPAIDAALLTFAATNSDAIDYDRLGRTIAENMPKQKSVSVNVDRTGISIAEGNGTTRIHNLKYAGQWT